VKKLLIPGLLFIVLLATCVYLVQNHLSYRNVMVKFGENIAGVEMLILQDDRQVKSVVNDSEIRIKVGEYTIKTTGSSDYNQVNDVITITEDGQEIFINPNYTEEKLATLLEGQENTLFSEIKSTVALGNTYKINPGKLYIHGDWYGTTIVPNLSDEELRQNYVDVFRVVAKREGDTWKLITEVPQLILNRSEYPEIPTEVLSETNRQYGDVDLPF